MADPTTNEMLRIGTRRTDREEAIFGMEKGSDYDGDGVFEDEGDLDEEMFEDEDEDDELPEDEEDDEAFGVDDD